MRYLRDSDSPESLKLASLLFELVDPAAVLLLLPGAVPLLGVGLEWTQLGVAPVSCEELALWLAELAPGTAVRHSEELDLTLGIQQFTVKVSSNRSLLAIRLRQPETVAPGRDRREFKLSDLLQVALANECSVLQLVAGAAPTVKLGVDWVPVGDQSLGRAEILELLQEALAASEWELLSCGGTVSMAGGWTIAPLLDTDGFQLHFDSTRAEI